MPAMEELFDVVTEDDVVIGQAPRSLCHGDPTLIHRAVHVLVFNPDGEILLQKRSPAKDIQPSKWDTSVGGHLERGESYHSAAYREMAEELGLVEQTLRFLYHSKIRNRIESENIVTYLTVTDQAIQYDPDEISSVRFWTCDEIENSLGRKIFTPNFEEEWRMLKAFLQKDHVVPEGDEGLHPGDCLPILRQKLGADA
jgi:isopentenyl-diphosphate delta-isomerase type 1